LPYRPRSRSRSSSPPRPIRACARILLFAAVTAVGTVLLVAAMMSIDTVRDLFLERAKAIQPYDVGPGGRFWEQRLALGVILDHPNGMGPFEFSRVFGMQQHDVYMQGFLVYGWLGGAAYLTLVAVTLAIGLATVRVPAPWQNYLIVAYATFVGEAVEGLIVDTDHWRHFFLLLGLIWGPWRRSISVAAWLGSGAPPPATPWRQAGAENQRSPRRTAIAVSQTRPAGQSAQNTAAEPKSLIRRMAGSCSRVTWSASFSTAVLSNSTAKTTNSVPIMATYQAGLGATTRPSGSARARTIASSRSAASCLIP
jgi:hypothetical protein